MGSKSNELKYFEKLYDPKAINLFFVRHRQADLKKKVPNLIDTSLTKTGRTQAKQIGLYLSTLKFDCIYTSDMTCAYQTAQEVSSHHPKTNFQVSKLFREITGLSRPDAPKNLDEIDAKIQRTEVTRVKKFSKLIRSTHQEGEQILLIGHAGVNSLLLSYLSNLSFRKTIPLVWPHTSIAVANVFPSSISIRITGHTQHLPTNLVTFINKS